MDIPIELKHLQTLLALRKTGSLTRAAAAMQLTQSALSHQIKQLEEHYNVTLFMRNFLLMHYVDESSILELRRVFRESFK
ncbi:LysR family transcriptional regulator [Klebsiella pneumoniae]|uniref:helix-turn-helix domain-containing protein n=1 Tax=Klebsiella pneumoniae TaxID=573 RepID=UPI003976AB38